MLISIPKLMEVNMEIYLFIALVFMYLLTKMMLPKRAQKKIWTGAYIVSFAITCVAIFFIRSYAQDMLMRAGELNWYYILYVFGAISTILGAINLWIYKKGVIALFTASDDEDDEDDDDA